MEANETVIRFVTKSTEITLLETRSRADIHETGAYR